MNTNRFITILTVLILAVTGVSGAAGMKAYASETVTTQKETKEAESKEAQAKKYTPYELGCMAQYYYKRTDKNGVCPPEVFVAVKNGAYEISLYENITDKDKEESVKTYAAYQIEADGKGTDVATGKAIDLTLYSKVYTPQELCKLAQNYYYTVNDFYPPQATYTANKDGTYTICLFESVTDEDGTAHNATCGWYTVNVCGLGTDDLMMQVIDING